MAWLFKRMRGMGGDFIKNIIFGFSVGLTTVRECAFYKEYVLVGPSSGLMQRSCCNEVRNVSKFIYNKRDFYGCLERRDIQSLDIQTPPE